MNWLNGNKVTKTTLYVIIQFVNWILSDNLINEETMELKYIKDELYILIKPESVVNK
jgi:hypothetical protein